MCASSGAFGFSSGCPTTSDEVDEALAFAFWRGLVSQSAGHFGGGAQFFGDIVGLIGIKVHRQLDPAIGTDIDPHHALIRRADLNVGGYIALLVDAHGRAPVFSSALA